MLKQSPKIQGLKKTLALLFIIIGLTGLVTAAVSLINPLSANIQTTAVADETSLLSGKNLFFLLGYVVLLLTGVWMAVSGRGK